MDARARTCCTTEIGICGLWDPGSFPMVYDARTWEAEVGNEPGMLRHMAGGYVVPLIVNCPGTFDFEVRVNWSGERGSLDEREAALEVASSEAYLFRSSGLVCFGGLECLDCVPSNDAGALDIEPGDYECRVHLLAWNEEPGCLTETGMKANEALPDFVVLLDRAEGSFRGSLSLQTFR